MGSKPIAQPLQSPMALTLQLLPSLLAIAILADFVHYPLRLPMDFPEGSSASPETARQCHVLSCIPQSLMFYSSWAPPKYELLTPPKKKTGPINPRPINPRQLPLLSPAARETAAIAVLSCSFLTAARRFS